MATVQGISEDRFVGLRKVFQDRLDSGDDLGASITVTIDGKNVVDIWGGYTTNERSQPWEENTIVNVWSSTKTVITLAVLMLVDRGLVDVNENVAKYWPEFAVNGKENVKVRHLLSHTAGLSGWLEPSTLEQLYDFERSTKLLAAQAPFFEPGSASGYHAITMGFLLGELVRRVTGKTMSEFIAEEIARPLKVDFQIGAREEDWPRVASVVPSTSAPLQLPAGIPDVTVKALTNPPWNPLDAVTPGWRAADMSAANGHSNARALSKILSAIALGGEVDGVRLLRPETIDLIFKQQSHGIDLVLGKAIQFGIGYGLCTAGDTAINTMLPKGRICFWSGWGGSMVVADTERRMSFSYTMNRMWINNGTMGNPNTAAYAQAIYAALGVTVGGQ